MKEWLFLIGAIVLETFATSMLKYSEQFTKLLPTTAMVVGYMFSFYCLSHALRTMPIGIALIMAGVIIINLFSKMEVH